MLPDIVWVEFRGEPALQLRGQQGERAIVLLRGGQLVSWLPAQGVEQLYCSPLTPAGATQPLRGGVPIVFPQFAALGPLPRHGFARISPWEWQNTGVIQGVPSVTLRLKSSARTRGLWPHDFLCDLNIGLDANQLTMTLAICNTGSLPLQFTAALHTYLRVGCTASAHLRGLPGQGAELRLEGPLDRIFYGTPGSLQLQSELGCLEIDRSGFADVVVWNPGPNSGIADLPAEDHTVFACVEAATIANPITLLPGAVFSAAQSLRWCPPE